MDPQPVAALMGEHVASNTNETVTDSLSECTHGQWSGEPPREKLLSFGEQVQVAFRRSGIDALERIARLSLVNDFVDVGGGFVGKPVGVALPVELVAEDPAHAVSYAKTSTGELVRVYQGKIIVLTPAGDGFIRRDIRGKPVLYDGAPIVVKRSAGPQRITKGFVNELITEVVLRDDTFPAGQLHGGWASTVPSQFEQALTILELQKPGFAMAKGNVLARRHQAGDTVRFSEQRGDWPAEYVCKNSEGDVYVVVNRDSKSKLYSISNTKAWYLGEVVNAPEATLGAHCSVQIQGEEGEESWDMGTLTEVDVCVRRPILPEYELPVLLSPQETPRRALTNMATTVGIG